MTKVTTNISWTCHCIKAATQAVSQELLFKASQTIVIACTSEAHDSDTDASNLFYFLCEALCLTCS